MKCNHCGKVVTGRKMLDWDKIKVGAKLIGYATKKEVTVTAIGKDRFLYLDSCGQERAGSKYSTQANWRKPHGSGGPAKTFKGLNKG